MCEIPARVNPVCSEVDVGTQAGCAADGGSSVAAKETPPPRATSAGFNRLGIATDDLESTLIETPRQD
jgi:hypothetical protein